jgi:hypothetical protein
MQGNAPLWFLLLIVLWFWKAFVGIMCLKNVPGAEEWNMWNHWFGVHRLYVSEIIEIYFDETLDHSLQIDAFPVWEAWGHALLRIENYAQARVKFK